MNTKKKILCATLGSCVHVAGIFNFIRLAQKQQNEIFLLRPPNNVDEILDEVIIKNPDIIALSYRLTPESAVKLIKELKQKLTDEMREKKWIFGGTTPVCKAVKPLGVFNYYFDSSTSEVDVFAFLQSYSKKSSRKFEFSQMLIERIEYSMPFPLLRAHFGLPSVKETRKGISRISIEKIIDIISIGPDQNFQESYFCPNEMKKSERGAGGVPIRSEKDLQSFYEASRQGNYPLLRCYSGTRNLIQMAELLQKTINNAWGATPLFWYSELDGRSSRPLLEAINENQNNMAWYGTQKIPFESNEAHHWSLRSASDAIAVTAAFLACYNAKKAGVKHYISQLMFDTPLGISPKFDLAKMLAKTELIENLHSDSFKSYRQVRTGLLSFPEDPFLAKGQLASSIQISMFLKPDIVHVVSFCEANHAATADDIIESAKIARKVISNSIKGLPSILLDQELINYKQQLIRDSLIILESIRLLADQNIKDPLIHPSTLVKAVELGILDAPHLKGLSIARGDIHTAIINGKCLVIDLDTEQPITEKERVKKILQREGYSISDLIKSKYSQKLAEKTFS
ncbi:MAG: methionine synthase [Candidatus Hodarchaeales archaeon]|jgi:hypothetical protein